MVDLGVLCTIDKLMMMDTLRERWSLEHLNFCFRDTVRLGLVSRVPSCITFPPSRQVMLLAFPVLGLRQPPAQERVFLCVRG